MAAQLPPNVHVSQSPLLRAKISLLRSESTNARDTKALVHEISLILGTEALNTVLQVTKSGTDRSPLGFEFEAETISPSNITIVPILRSGLAMLEGIQTILPQPASVHHLGLFREPSSLQPVEYYNNLPFTRPGPGQSGNPSAAKLAILVDPVIATGGTAAAAIQTLKDWGVERIIVLSVLGSVGGLTKAAEEWAEATEIWVARMDQEITATGMIKPGLGDVGDRLFLTLGK